MRSAVSFRSVRGRTVSLVNDHDLVGQVDPKRLACILLEQEVVRQRDQLSRLDGSASGVVRAHLTCPRFGDQVFDVAHSGENGVSSIEKRALVTLRRQKLAPGGTTLLHVQARFVDLALAAVTKLAHLVVDAHLSTRR